MNTDEESVEGAARHFGIGAAAIASAGEAVQTSQENRVWLLVFGLALLAWFSLGFVRALVIAYSLAWGLPRQKIRRPLHAIVFFNGVVLAVAVATSGLAWLRDELGLLGILGVIATVVFQAAMTLIVMWFLPHRALRWPELIPGALLVAVGSQVIAVAVAFYFAPKIGRSSELYGTLGAASVLLVWLYVLARLITSGAFLNVTLWERRNGEVAASRVGSAGPGG